MMLEARAVGIRSRGDEPLPPTTLRARSGEVVAVAVETDERPRLLALALGGRVRPSVGGVSIDGEADAASLRRRVAVVDAPFASEPDPGLRLRTVVAEELAFLGRGARRRSIMAVLDRFGVDAAARTRIGALGAAPRIRLLVGLAADRPGVDAVVLTSPERHGGDPAEWMPALLDLAARGLAVVVVTDVPTAAALARLGAGNGSGGDSAAEGSAAPLDDVLALTGASVPTPALSPAPASAPTATSTPAIPRPDQS